MRVLEASQLITLLPDTLASFSLPENIYSNEILIFSLFLYFVNVFALPNSVVFSIQWKNLISTAPWTLRIREDKQNLCSDSWWSMIFPSTPQAPDDVAGLAPWKDGPSSWGCPSFPIIPRRWWFRMVHGDSQVPVSPISHCCLKALSSVEMTWNEFTSMMIKIYRSSFHFFSE